MFGCPISANCLICGVYCSRILSSLKYKYTIIILVQYELSGIPLAQNKLQMKLLLVKRGEVKTGGFFMNKSVWKRAAAGIFCSDACYRADSLRRQCKRIC